MVDLKSDSSQVTQSWDTYWQGTGDVGAYSSGGVNHPIIMAFWEEFFQTVKQDYGAPSIIDIASGNGAVIEHALAALGDPDITCLDVSGAAITNIRNRFPRVRGMVADACSIPLDSGGFDIATSQFGVEYAGLEAVDEAARMVAAGGRLALLLHNQTGSIHQECTENLDATLQLQKSRFIPYAIQMLSAGFEACRGADRAPYETAATRLAPAVQTLESIMMQYGEHIAGNTIARLYSDVDRIHRNIQRHEPVEVLDWLNKMDSELEAYVGRMSSMCTSAIDGETFNLICAGLSDRDYTLKRAEPLVAPDHDLPLAWVLVVTNEIPKDTTAGSTRYQSKDKSENTDNRDREELQAWIKLRLDAAVKELIHNGVVDNRFIEAKPAWVFPFQVLIGKIRNLRDSTDIKWFICGEVPTDHLDLAAASTPRTAARHFAMKWQLEAARQQDLPGPESTTGQVQESREPGNQLAEQAEALYALADDARLWQQQDGF